MVSALKFLGVAVSGKRRGARETRRAAAVERRAAASGEERAAARAPSEPASQGAAARAPNEPASQASQDGRPPADFAAALEELFRAVQRASGRGVPGGETELTMSQYWVMDAAAEQPLTVSEVAHAARVAVPSATRALRALERRGFVERRRDAGEDGRHVTVALTPSGRAVLDEKRAWVRARQREIFDVLSSAERRTAARTLAVLAREIGEL